MAEIDMGNGKGPGDKGIVFRIELALDPVRPDPVQVVLDHAAVYQPACVKHHTGTQQFDRLAHLRGLGKAMQPGQQRNRVEEPVRTGDTTNEEPPR